MLTALSLATRDRIRQAVNNTPATQELLSLLDAIVTEVNGLAGAFSDVFVISSDTVLTQPGIYLVNASTGTRTLTLYTAVGKTGERVIIKKTDASANHAVLAGGLGQTIDGSSSKSMTEQYASIEVVSDGSNWQIIA